MLVPQRNILNNELTVLVVFEHWMQDHCANESLGLDFVAKRSFCGDCKHPHDKDVPLCPLVIKLVDECSLVLAVFGPDIRFNTNICAHELVHYF